MQARSPLSSRLRRARRQGLPKRNPPHAALHVSALLDEPNLTAGVGLLPLVALAQRFGRHGLAAQVRIDAADDSGGAHAAVRLACQPAVAGRLPGHSRIRPPLAIDTSTAPIGAGNTSRWIRAEQRAAEKVDPGGE